MIKFIILIRREMWCLQQIVIMRVQYTLAIRNRSDVNLNCSTGDSYTISIGNRRFVIETLFPIVLCLYTFCADSAPSYLV